jgi:hypothetical protein
MFQLARVPRNPAVHSRGRLIDDGQKCNPAPARPKLLGHFKRDDAAERVAAEVKRPFGLQLKQLVGVMCC